MALISFPCFVLLPELLRSATAASLAPAANPTEDHPAIMRKEFQSRDIRNHREFSGEDIPERTFISSRGEFQADHRTHGGIAGRSSRNAVKTCEWVYLLGVPGSTSCGATPREKLLNIEECRWAASQMGYQQGDSTREPYDFDIVNQSWTVKYPEGCFLEAGTTPPVAWYNSFGGSANEPTGTPICRRPRYLNGTLNTADSCPTSMDHVTNETACRIMADCVGNHLDEDSFMKGIPGFKSPHGLDNPDNRQTNTGNFNYWPTGCFFQNGPTDFGVFYNVPSSDSSPTNPHGFPICAWKQCHHADTVSPCVHA